MMGDDDDIIMGGGSIKGESIEKIDLGLGLTKCGRKADSRGEKGQFPWKEQIKKRENERNVSSATSIPFRDDRSLPLNGTGGYRGWGVSKQRGRETCKS